MALFFDSNTCISLALPKRLSLPSVKDTDVLTFDWAEEEFSDDELEDLTTSNAKLAVESLEQAFNMPTSKSDALALTKELAATDTTLASHAELVNMQDILSSPAREESVIRQQVSVTIPTVVFANTLQTVKYIVHVLREANVDSVYIHGLVEPDDRRKALAQFASGQTKVLVTTPLLARGVDLPNCKHVINYDFPEDVTTYIHQAGRTARGTSDGQVTTIVTKPNLNKAKSLRAGDAENTQLTIAAGRKAAPALGTPFWGTFGTSSRIIGADTHLLRLVNSAGKVTKAMVEMKKIIEAAPAAKIIPKDTAVNNVLKESKLGNSGRGPKFIKENKKGTKFIHVEIEKRDKDERLRIFT